MKDKPIITKVELHEFGYEMKDVGRDLDFALGPYYEPGSVLRRTVLALRVLWCTRSAARSVRADDNVL